MSITNHLLAGALIGLAISNPALAIVAGYSSHFLMDAVPHFGYPGGLDFISAVKIAAKHKGAYIYSIGTIITFATVLLWLLITRNYYALSIGLIAVSPDAIMTAYYYFCERKGKKPESTFAWINLKFHGRIQFERPWAIFTELITLTGLGYLLITRI